MDNNNNRYNNMTRCHRDMYMLYNNMYNMLLYMYMLYMPHASASRRARFSRTRHVASHSSISTHPRLAGSDPGSPPGDSTTKSTATGQ